MAVTEPDGKPRGGRTAARHCFIGNDHLGVEAVIRKIQMYIAADPVPYCRKGIVEHRRAML